jgi:hypothetical protein
MSDDGATINGELEMFGTWEKAFGYTFLHLSDIKLRVEVLINSVPAVPIAIQGGVTVCIGAADACSDSTSKHSQLTFIIMIYLHFK